ncbi:MAG: Transcriptional regulator [Lactobacillus delbrueckii]|jgi:hypothetical protein
MLLTALIYLSWGELIVAIAFLMCKPSPLTTLIFLGFMLTAYWSVMIV